jgi:hypothetical protein
MTTIKFIDRELIFDDELLEDIPLFDNIKKYKFKEYSDKKAELYFSSDAFITLLRYKSIDFSFDKDREFIELCDFLCMEDTKNRYIETHDYKKLYKNGIIDKEDYIINLIIEKKGELYFTNDNHFENFFNNPLEVIYTNNVNNNSILFYLTIRKYNLLERALDSNLFDIININKNMCYTDNKFKNFYNILSFSCKTIYLVIILAI